MTPPDGRSYCAQTYGAQMMVPNSVDEARFIGKYLSTLRVTKITFHYFGKLNIFPQKWLPKVPSTFGVACKIVNSHQTYTYILIFNFNFIKLLCFTSLPLCNLQISCKFEEAACKVFMKLTQVN